MLYILLSTFIGINLARQINQTITGSIVSQTFVQMMINPIKMFNSEFNPGEMVFSLDIKLFNTQPYSLLFFSASEDPVYQCFVYSRMNDIVKPDYCFSQMENYKCNQCGTQIKKYLEQSLSNDSQIQRFFCNCTEIQDFKLNIIHQIQQIKTSAPLLLIFNNDTHSYKSINYQIHVNVDIVPDTSDFELTWILVTIFVLLIILLTTVLCVLNIKYKNAKDKQKDF